VIWSFFFVSVTAILTPVFFRYSEAVRDFASPHPLPRAGWIALIVLALACAVICALRDHPYARSEKRVFLELLVIPAFFLYEWAFLPPYRIRIIDYAALALLFGTVAVRLWGSRDRWGELGLTTRNFRSALQWAAGPTAVFVIASIALRLFLETRGLQRPLDPGRIVESLAGYPFWAFLQLLVFQVYLVPRLQRLSRNDGETIAVATGLFTLLHWPNPILMPATAILGLVWTITYLKRPNVYALALTMGIAATAFSTLLPKDFTQNLRTGPIYVQRLVDAADRSPR